MWSCELDIYGKVRTLAGSKTFIPFRYQGQYEDEETNLYYNRFRYYSPDSGTYISQDPIGLAGQMPNMYSYVHDLNSWTDPFGLEMVTVYHYTSVEGYNGIKGNGVIEARDPNKRGKGAKNKGKGVFATTISPENLQKSKKRGVMGLVGNKSTHFIKFDIDKSLLNSLDPQNPGLRIKIDDNVELRDSNNKLKKNVEMGKVPCN